MEPIIDYQQKKQADSDAFKFICDTTSRFFTTFCAVLLAGFVLIVCVRYYVRISVRDFAVKAAEYGREARLHPEREREPRSPEEEFDRIFGKP